MKFSRGAVYAILAASLPTITSAKGGPIVTCNDQYDCIDFTVTKNTPAHSCTTQQCDYTVCMKLDFSNTGCNKGSGDSVSHSCEKVPNQCSAQDLNMFDGGPSVSSENSPVHNGEFHCIQVKGGGVAQFILKDGNGNCGSFTRSPSVAGGLGTASCAQYVPQVFDETRTCTSSGNECLWNITVPNDCPNTGGGGGEPHINLWNSTQFDYHGECDLVLLDNPRFNTGEGMNVHIRTTQEPFGYADIPEFYYSFIESAAIRIGDDVLEFTGDDFFINGDKGSDSDLPTTIGSGFVLNYPTFKEESEAKHYLIDLNDGDYILFYKYMHFMSLVVSGSPKDFGTSVGIMGDFHTSDMLARDGMTLLHDPNEFGSEWQVHEDEPKLFRSLREPQHPHAACKVPDNAKVTAARRHLRKDEAFLKAAEGACGHKSIHGFESCVFDVLATRDLNMAHAWGL